MEYRQSFYYENNRKEESPLTVVNNEDAWLYAEKLFQKNSDASAITQTIFKNGKIEISIYSKKKLLIKIQSV